MAQFVLFFQFGCVVSPPLVRVQFILCASGSARRPGCWSRCPEHILRGVGDVEEAVSVAVAGINLSHAGGHAGHALLCHQEEQSLGGVQSNLIPNRKKGKKETDGEVVKGWKTTEILGQRRTKHEGGRQRHNGKSDSLGEKRGEKD